MSRADDFCDRFEETFCVALTETDRIAINEMEKQGTLADGFYVVATPDGGIEIRLGTLWARLGTFTVTEFTCEL